MEREAHPNHGPEDALLDPDTQPAKFERMSYWQWLLFAAMAHLELQEDAFLHIRNAKTIRRVVRVQLGRKRERKI